MKKSPDKLRKERGSLVVSEAQDKLEQEELCVCFSPPFSFSLCVCVDIGTGEFNEFNALTIRGEKLSVENSKQMFVCSLTQGGSVDQVSTLCAKRKISLNVKLVCFGSLSHR